MNLLLLFAACGLPPESLDCDASSVAVTGTLAPASREGIDADLYVTGTASSPGGLAIRSVSVLGIPATRTGFNYATWSVTVPLAQLRALDGDADLSVTLSAVAVDSCGTTWTIRSETDATTGIVVTLAGEDTGGEDTGGEDTGGEDTGGEDTGA